MEKKIVPIPINRSKAEIGAISVSHFENKRKAGIALLLAGFLFLGAGPLLAAETVKKEGALQQINSIEKRGLVNFATAPLEFVNTAKSEKKDHPKAWLVTYVPRLFMNLATRVASSANDFIVLPFSSAMTHDTTPLTRRFDMPDYVWQEE